MKNFRTLDLSIEFYELIKPLQMDKRLRNQLHRAASSISLNLSEGNAKGSALEKKHFFQTAYASLRECQTIFRLSQTNDESVLSTADKLGAHLYRLINSEIQSSPNWRK
ncbi:MAG: four helix bundle protein [Bdellovibrionales bacterium]